MQRRYKENFQRYKHILYILDNSFLFNLIKEIHYYKDIKVLLEEDVKLIKIDLINVFDKIQTFLKTKIMPPFKEIEYEVYIANFNIALAAFYISGGDIYLSGIKTPFLNSYIRRDYDTGHKIDLWINNLKNFSTLISGSGEKERMLFLEELRALIETL